MIQEMNRAEEFYLEKTELYRQEFEDLKINHDRKNFLKEL